MGFSNAIYAAAIEKKRVLRQHNDAIRESNQQKLYETIPRLKEIDYELSQLGINTTMAVFNNNKEKINELKEKCQALKSEKDALIPDGYEVPYECDICKDSGFVNGKYCECIEREARNIQFSTLSSAAPFEECRIDNFDLSYYPIEGEGKFSPKVRMEKNFEYIKKYISSFPTGENLLLVGNTGLGKTHLSIAIASEIIVKGYGVFYSSAENLISNLQKEKFGKSDAEFNYNDAALQCDLLILDDLGTEFSTQFSKSVIYDIINTRILTKKSTIINTNLFMPEIKEQYSPRIASRLIGEYTTLLFEGADIRQIKKIKPSK